MNLFLDDERQPRAVKWIDLPLVDWTVVRSYHDFVTVVTEHGIPARVSFDHDLGEDKNGYDCAKWLINRCLDLDEPFPEYTVHSKNPIGAENIVSLIEALKHQPQP